MFSTYITLFWVKIPDRKGLGQLEPHSHFEYLVWWSTKLLFNRGWIVPQKNIDWLLEEEWASQVVLVVKNLPANARDPGSIPGSGRSPGGGHGNPFQYSCLENPKEEEPGRLQSISSHKSQTRLKRLSRQAHTPKWALHFSLRIGILALETYGDPRSVHFKGTMLIWLNTF